MKFNKELLLRVKDQILAHPEQFDLDVWISRGNSMFLGTKASISETELWRESLKANSGGCGTVGCIAGWTITLANDQDFRIAALCEESGEGLLEVPALAARLLGLTTERADALFLPSNWPKVYSSEYVECLTAVDQVAVAAAYIDAFIIWVESCDAVLRPTGEVLA